MGQPLWLKGCLLFGSSIVPRCGGGGQQEGCLSSVFRHLPAVSLLSSPGYTQGGRLALWSPSRRLCERPKKTQDIHMVRRLHEDAGLFRWVPGFHPGVHGPRGPTRMAVMPRRMVSPTSCLRQLRASPPTLCGRGHTPRWHTGGGHGVCGHAEQVVHAEWMGALASPGSILYSTRGWSPSLRVTHVAGSPAAQRGCLCRRGASQPTRCWFTPFRWVAWVVAYTGIDSNRDEMPLSSQRGLGCA